MVEVVQRFAEESQWRKTVVVMIMVAGEVAG